MKAREHTKNQAIRTVNGAVIDLAHLDQYTLGDQALQAELLHLFRTQLKEQTEALRGCVGQPDWQSACHTLKGAARAIGAVQISHQAEALEAMEFAAIGDREAVLGHLVSAATDFEAEIEGYL